METGVNVGTILTVTLLWPTDSCPYINVYGEIRAKSVGKIAGETASGFQREILWL